jgi:hypothetical protein
MKELIRKILKEESLKQENLKKLLKQQVKEDGWEFAADLVNGPEDLAKLAFNNNPMEFLNMFNDLDVFQSEEGSNWTLFRYEKGNNVMVYNRINDNVYINYDVIWLFLQKGFDLNYIETQELTKIWLSEAYNLRGVITYASPPSFTIVV